MLKARGAAAIRGGNPLPQGTLAIAVGLALAGASQYAFLAVAARALGPVDYSPFATFWSMLFILGPGFFLPFEQEVGRALAHRRAQRQGGGPLVRRALLASGMLALVLLAVTGLSAGLLADHFFRGEALFVAALALGLLAYACLHTTRGTLSGSGRFGAYGLLIGAEGTLRVLGCIVLAIVGVKVAGLYGFALVVASFAAIAIALAPQRNLLPPGRQAPWSELSSALGFLLVASVVTYFLLSAGPVVIPLLERPDQVTAAGQFLNGRVIAYIPLFFFQAVQAALLPRLAGLAAAGRLAEFRRTLGRLLAFTAGLGLVGTVGAFLLGPWAVRLLFGAGSQLGGRDLGLLELSCTGFMLAIAVGQALISLHGYRAVALGWLAGAVAFAIVVLTGSELFLRVELGLCAGAAVPVLLMAALLRRRLHSGLARSSTGLAGVAP
jgi:O-antigen/teichoic acid export membrane protein